MASIDPNSSFVFGFWLGICGSIGIPFTLKVGDYHSKQTKSTAIFCGASAIGGLATAIYESNIAEAERLQTAEAIIQTYSDEDLLELAETMNNEYIDDKLETIDKISQYEEYDQATINSQKAKVVEEYINSASYFVVKDLQQKLEEIQNIKDDMDNVSKTLQKTR